MNPITFPCTHCSQSLTVPPDAVGRAVPCPHCRQAILVPPAPALRAAVPVKSRGVESDQGPDFSETLRKAREATDSIFHDHDDEGDSLFGEGDTPRRLFVPPPAPAASQTPTALTDPTQPTLRIPGLPNLPPIRSGSTPPLAERAVFVPRPSAASDNPFEDLSTDSSPDGSDDDLQSSGAMVEDDGDEDAVRRAFPWKNLLIATLAIYAAVATAFAAWGWLRTPEAPKGAPPHSSGKP